MTQRLCHVFTKSLELPAETDAATLQRDFVESWDSLAHISLITAIENEFDLIFNADDYARITSFEAVVEILQARGIE
ncbi:MAG: acyl carrier protein [Terrimicrobiaceae bacterium]